MHGRQGSAAVVAEQPLQLSQPELPQISTPMSDDGPSLPSLEWFVHTGSLVPDYRIFKPGSPPEAFTEDTQHFIRLAQVMVDQAVSTSSWSESYSLIGDYYSQTPLGLNLAQKYMVTKIIQTCLGHAESYSLGELNTDPSIKHEISRPNHISTVLSRMHPPKVRIRRMDASLDILPSAIGFWEELGLEPASGTKDFMAFSISHERKEHLHRPLMTFLEQMRDAYQACNLGDHKIAAVDDDFIEAAGTEDYEALGRRIAQYEPGSRLAVVYLVSSAACPSSNLEACSGVQRLLAGFRSGGSSINDECDLVIQIIPEYLLFKADQIALPAFSTYKRIAFEVYNRAGSAESVDHSFISANAITLSKVIPRDIAFQLTSDSSSAVLHHDTHVHVAYAISRDREWMAVSWTDNEGLLQWNAAYSLGNDEEVRSEIAKVTNEVLETTLMMLNPSNRPHRIFIAKEGRYSRDEFKGKFIDVS